MPAPTQADVENSFEGQSIAAGNVVVRGSPLRDLIRNIVTYVSTGVSGNVPVGGDTGQVLTKQSDNDNDVDWEDITLTGQSINDALGYIAANKALGGTETFLSPGTPGDYTLAKSGIVVKNAAGDEVFRIWATDPDDLNNYNSGNLYIGMQAGFGQPTNNVDAGFHNLGIFNRALYSITTGFDNYGIGHESLYSLTSGSDNTAVGFKTLREITAAASNTAIGNAALFYLASGDGNTAVGGSSGVIEGSPNVSNSFTYGFEATVSESNRGVLGNESVTDIYFGSESAMSTIHAAGYTVGGVAGVDGTFDATDLATKTVTVVKGIITDIS